MTKKQFCVIGSPVAHSLSPLIHNTLYKRYGLDCEYTVREVTPETLPAFVAGARDSLCGFNITMPLKLTIKPFLNECVAPLSVNTVVVREGKLYGYSTDEDGFERGLSGAGKTLEGACVVILGAGGVARSLARRCVARGSSVTILNRTLPKAAGIAAAEGCEADILDFANGRSSMERCDILVNATPLGMTGCEPMPSLDFLRCLKKDALVYDLIYKPDTTRLLAAAAEHGLATLNGLPMLVWQAFYAFEKFVGILPGEDDLNAVLEAVR